MKIREIIASRVVALDEGVVGSVFAKIAKLAAKAPKTQAADILAKSWANEAIGAGPKLSASVLKQAEEAARANGIADDVIKAASKSAAKIVQSTEAKIGFHVAKNGVAWLGDAAWKTLAAWGISEPLWTAYSNISKAQKLHDQGDPNYDDQKLAGYIQSEIAFCSAKVAALIAGNKLIRMAPAAIGLTSIFAGATSRGVFNVTTRAAQTAYMALLATPEGQKHIADWIVGNSFSSTVWKNFVAPAVMSATEWIKSKISGPATTDATSNSPDTARDSVTPTSPEYSEPDYKWGQTPRRDSYTGKTL